MKETHPTPSKPQENSSESDSKKRQEIRTELDGFKIGFSPEVFENLVILDENTDFIEDSRDIAAGVEKVIDFIKKGDSFQIGLMDERRARLASHIHDIGKAGPSTDPDCRLAVTKLFSVEGIKNERQKVTVTLQIYFPNEVEDMIENLRKADISPDMTMREFWDKHAFWTKDVLEASSGVFDEATKRIAASHHIDSGIDPYRVTENFDQISNETRFLIFLLMAMDKYQALRVRSNKTHEEAMDTLNQNLGRKYEGNSFMRDILEAINHLGGSGDLFRDSKRSQKRFAQQQTK